MTQDKAQKSATRRRMAETGEPYSVARRVVEDEQTSMWVAGVADGTRVIVQGQDFVREGQRVDVTVAPEQSVSR